MLGSDALSSWNDHRIVDASWVDIHIWFFLHIYADLAKYGLELRGHTLRENYAGWLLVVKVQEGDIPLVGFLSGDTPTACMKRLRNCLRSDEMKWTRDKYA